MEPYRLWSVNHHLLDQGVPLFGPQSCSWVEIETLLFLGCDYRSLGSRFPLSWVKISSRLRKDLIFCWSHEYSFFGSRSFFKMNSFKVSGIFTTCHFFRHPEVEERRGKIFPNSQVFWTHIKIQRFSNRKRTFQEILSTYHYLLWKSISLVMIAYPMDIKLIKLSNFHSSGFLTKKAKLD